MFRSQLLSEIRKGTSSIAWQLLVIASILAGPGIATVLAFIGVYVERSPLDFGRAEHVQGVVGSAATLTYSLVTIIGVLIVTSEYHTATVGQTLLANPRRWAVYLAKLTWAALTGLIVAVISIVLTVAGLLVVLGGTEHGFDPTAPNVVSTLVGIMVINVVWTLAGAGIGAIIREQLVAVLIVIIVTQVIEPVIRLTAIEGIIRLTPSNLTDAATGGGLLSLVTGVDLLEQGVAIAVLVGFAVVISAIGMVRFERYEFN